MSPRLNSSRGHALGIAVGVIAALSALGVLGLLAWLFLSSSGGAEPLSRPVSTAPAVVEDPALPEPAVLPERVDEAPRVNSTSLNLTFQPRVTPGGRPLHIPRSKDEEPAYTLSGRVRDRDTGDPVMFFRLYLVPIEEGDPIQAAETWQPQSFRNMEGSFSLDYLPAGHYHLLCRSESHQDWVRENLVIPFEGELDIALSRGTWVSGTVRDDSGYPLERMEVFLHPIELEPGYLAPRVRIKKTDAHGYFEFTNLPPGRFSMSCGPLGDPLAAHEEFYLNVGDHLDRSFQLPRQTTVMVRVTNLEGTAIPRAMVMLVADGGRSLHREHADHKGEARLLFVKRGTYQLKIHAPLFESIEEEFVVPGGNPYIELERSLKLIPR